jgi:diguanylate cyclase (GGDEF)-like protein/PAS domain S-box-containing protein
MTDFDISERDDTTPSARDARSAFSFVEASGDAMVAADAEGRITLWNRAAADLFGYPAETALGKSLDIIIPEAMRGEHAAGMRRIVEGGRPRLIGKPVELQARRADGALIPIEMRICVWLDGDRRFGAVIRDLSDRRRAEERLHGLAHFDQLTMLPNRNLFLNRLQKVLALAGPGGQITALIVDLDNFAEINDGYGYSLGDDLLCRVARELKRLTGGRSDGVSMASRMGANQFGLALAGAGVIQAMEFAESVRRSVQEIAAQLDLVASASIGIAMAPVHGSSPGRLLANADFALRRAKQEGGDRSQLFDSRQREAFRIRRDLEAELKRAWADGEFEVFYQPQVRLADRAVVGGEALLRWRHPKSGLLLPGAFLHALKDGTLAERVGDFVLQEACRQAAAWRKTTGRPFRIGVNLFERQFIRSDQPQRVAEALEVAGLSPEELELEITETVMTGSDDASIRRVGRLRDLGVGIAFDDYGTGYASLGLLKRYPITRLKVDRSFVRDLAEEGEGKSAIVDLILALGERFGLGVIAEGVETDLQMKRLLALGCAEGQGYLFGKPMPAEGFTGLLDGSHAALQSGRGGAMVA